MEYPMTNTPEKMSGTSLDIAADKRERLKQIFPTVFTETVDATGKLVESMDFEKLKAELGTFTDLFEIRRERYGMDWPGKKEALKLIQTVSTATLKPCREESVNFDTTENLFIEGDNLEVLKLLQKSYYGKVKMIYIDPPYNTGNEFIYPDNFSETLETYLEYAGLVDGDGKKFSTNTANEGRFHTKWMNMMYPRLYLARNLLRDDGVIFISIDDNEVSNLKKVCDEVFGEENFEALISWRRRHNQPNDGTKMIAKVAEQIIVYSKHSAILKELKSYYGIPLSESRRSDYRNPDHDKRGPWATNPWKAAVGRGGSAYKLTTPTGKVFNETWYGNIETFNLLLADNRVHWTDGGNGFPRIKIFLQEAEEKGQPAINFLTHDEFGSNQDGSAELGSLFGVEGIFDNPKPVKLISAFGKIATKGTDIILDFFAGSGTTAHAALDLNKHDNGNRKFIMVQLPEPCTEDSEAFKAGHKTIADIGKERIRRVIKKLEAEQNGKLPFDNASPQDRGFKVLKLDKSNFKQWQSLPPDTTPETLVKQLKLFIDHIDPKARPEDLLYEILIKAGFPPSEQIESQTLAGKTVYSIAGGGLLLCLEDKVSAELINAVAEAEPMQFICLDAAFGGNDQLKANTVQTFAARNMGKEKHNQTVFKTV